MEVQYNAVQYNIMQYRRHPANVSVGDLQPGPPVPPHLPNHTLQDVTCI